MQLNISPKKNKILETLSKDKLFELEEFLEFQLESHITSIDLKNRLNISLKDAKQLLKMLFDLEIIEPNYKVFCENAIDMCIEKTYTCITDIPEQICDGCEKGCSIYKNIVVVYRVVKDNLNE